MITTTHRIAGLALTVSCLVLPLAAQEKDKDKDKLRPLPPPDRVPHLVLAHAGPHAPVSALAFSPDGSALYVGGFDKQVRRYDLIKGKYVAAASIRVPIGPGNAGVVNALAVSPDGKWVAAAGRAPMRGEVWVGADDGIGTDFRRLLPEVRADLGVVYLFDPTNLNGGKVLRGTRAGVRSIAFADPAPMSGPALVTAGIEYDAKTDKQSGVVRAFDVNTGNELTSQGGFPLTNIPPGLAAWAVGAEKKALRVAVSWQKAGTKDGGELVVWDAGNAPEKIPDTIFNAPLAVRVGKGGATEVISGGIEPNGGKYVGRLAVRSSDTPGAPTRHWLTGDAGTLLVPLAVAPLGVKGTDATAVLAQITPPPAGATGRPLQLMMLDAKGGALGKPVALAGVSDQMRPVLAASPDGRFVAVAGFGDNRVEVYDAASVAAGNPAVEKLAGGARGFSKVAFLAGEKIWLGGPSDDAPKGGVILDLDRNVRAAAPPGKDTPKVDAPKVDAEPRLLAPDAANKAWRVVAKVDGAEKTIALPDGVRPTAAALLPAKPAWDADLGAVVAVAHAEDFSQTVQLTLYDPSSSKALLKLGGPTLAVKSLAFSGSRALLAVAGEDGTVAVWSLKNLTRPWPAIEGTTIADREGKVVVVAVRDGVPAAGKLKAEDVVESVADAKGAQKAVKTPLDFVFAVRALKVGDKAKIKLAGQAAVVEVEVGARTGFRHPLFTLWVDPVAKDGKHDWVGWTPSGPYDASGEAGEARIGWVTATGDPARPVAFAGAAQYRKPFYKRDLLRLLVETADYNRAIGSLPRPDPPALTLIPVGAESRGEDRFVARQKVGRVDVRLSDDPDDVLALDPAALEWQVTGPGGASEWKRESFGARRLDLDLSKYDWTRGEHRVHVKLFATRAVAADAPPLRERTVAVTYIPPAPALAVKVDGKEILTGAEIETKLDEVEVSATVTKGDPAGATVTVSATGAKAEELAGDDKPVSKKVKIQPDGTTVVLVTATNRGAVATAADESDRVELRFRKTKPVPPPAIKLLVETPFDSRTATDQPYVVSTQKVLVTASVTAPAKEAVEFEWKVGDGPWEAGKLVSDAQNPAAGAQTRELDLGALQKDDTTGVAVQVRAKTAKSGFATDAAMVRYDGLPEVSVTVPPVLVSAPELNLTGGLKVTGKRPFKVRVLVTSARTGRTREFDPMPNPALTAWEAKITLFPGENRLGYVVRYDNDRKELPKPALVSVQYVRPPLVVGAAPIEAGTGAVGDVALAVLAAPDAPPAELLVNGARVGFRASARPVRLFGAGLWVVRARGVPVNLGPDRMKPLDAVVRNAEAESPPVPITVRAAPIKPIAPPTVRVTYNGKVIGPDQALPPLGSAAFAFELTVRSDTPLTRVELWRGVRNTPSAQVNGVSAATAVAAPGGGFVLTARPTVELCPGPGNSLRVVATNEGGTEEVAFNVSYAPPPVRVVIDSVTEPGGKSIPVRPGSAEEIPVQKELVEVRGRVQWDFDDDPVAKAPYLSVVLVANGVAHLPVRLGPANGHRERPFAAAVSLNTFDPGPGAAGATRVRAELRSGDRPVPIPQEGLQQAAVTVRSAAPERRQRMHVLMVGVEVPAAERPALVRRVVAAVGGKIPDGKSNFTSGRFERKDFEFAYLYPPRLDYTTGRDLNALLGAVRCDIEERATRAGKNFVNDLIVVYYHGEDWVDERTGRWLLHSAATLSGAAGTNRAAAAIRLDGLPHMPGMPVAVVNVASKATPGGNLALDLPYMRVAWAAPSGRDQLLALFAKGVSADRRTFGGVAEFVDKGAAQGARTLTSLPDEGVGSRVVGLP